MANLATNECIVVFNKDTTLYQKMRFLVDFKNKLCYDGPYNDPCPEEDNNTLEISYGTKWSEQQELLQELSNKYQCEIIGVCYEWGCLYVNSFDINPIEDLFEVIAEQTKPLIHENI